MMQTSGSGRAVAIRSAGQIAIALTIALLGFLLAIQLRSQQNLTDRLAIERESDLGQLLGELTGRSDRLLADIIDLQARLSGATGSAAQQKALLAGARDEVQALQIMLGIVPVEGEGIVMTIRDPSGTVGPDAVLDLVQELRDAGAEAIEIGGVRIVASTPFSGREGAVLVGETTLRPPITIKVIGPASTLAQAMRIPGGVVDAVATREGASVRISERTSVSILSVSPPPTFRHARPRPRR